MIHADAGADEGVDARTAFGAPESALPIPSVPLPPRRPGAPAALPVDPPPWRSGLREDLVELAADAASRAWEMAVGLSADAGLSLDADADLARRAGRALGTPAFGALAARSGVGERDLARHALAWRQGGLTGLDSLHAEWDPVEDDPDAARLLTAARSALRAKTGAARPTFSATGSPQAACSFVSAGTCAGIRMRGRTTAGNPAAPPRLIRPGP